MDNQNELAERANGEGRNDYDFNYPIWKCVCGHLNRFADTFGEICLNCNENHTLDWEKMIVDDEVKQLWNGETTVYAVLRNQGGSHESMDVMSVWSTLKMAEAERDKLNMGISDITRDGCEVRAWKLDVSGDVINW
jgi:hypothetical protein